MSKRLWMAGVAAALSVAAIATAQPAPKTYADPQGRFTLQHPGDWPVDVISRPGDAAYGVAIGIADAECKVYATPRAESAGKPADSVRRAYMAPIGRTEWKAAADGLNIWNDRGTVTEDTVDASQYFPVQRASFTTDSGKPGYGAMTARPGLDVWMFCSSYDDTDRKAIFERIFTSFAGPTDAALAAEGAAADAARDAARAKADQDAAAAAAAAAAKQQKKKR